MKDKKNLRTIQTVLGDDVRTYFNIEGASVTSTLTARFVCADLDLNVELTLETLDDNLQKWLLFFPTTDLRPGEFYYDFMVQGVDSTGNTQITTHIYHGRFIVLPKNPPRTTYKEYWSYPHNIKKEHD